MLSFIPKIALKPLALASTCLLEIRKQQVWFPKNMDIYASLHLICITYSLLVSFHVYREVGASNVS